MLPFFTDQEPFPQSLLRLMDFKVIIKKQYILNQKHFKGTKATNKSIIDE